MNPLFDPLFLGVWQPGLRHGLPKLVVDLSRSDGSHDEKSGLGHLPAVDTELTLRYSARVPCIPHNCTWTGWRLFCHQFNCPSVTKERHVELLCLNRDGRTGKPSSSPWRQAGWLPSLYVTCQSACQGTSLPYGHSSEACHSRKPALPPGCSCAPSPGRAVLPPPLFMM